ncbi:cytochrome o ubiquinol oxidase subunit 2 [Sphingomonas vulcanisoli]|uniref:Ubiquinol oxidase subunit 2 n=1 Tax=Sphingomonas vulcanisoli TaxID=1658060 RepID=A0ABX0TLU6_9SPHN|nr:ubiquinol oxidase subunit II [Sphingomonas vulcanisoli]NIJ06489.1 cytochrome o ubiquinol oxidase subunit 2 [Sphingomonas vulcanisoli]
MAARFPARSFAPFGLLALGGCSAVLDPQGPVGQGDRIILIDALLIMLCIVVPTILGTLAFAWWFRASNTKARRLPEFTYSGRVELLVWSIPVLIVLFLGGIAWIGSHELDPAKPIAAATPGGAKPIEVDVVSLDWKWLFLYPEQGIATVNQLTVPAGAPIHFRITSASVMNAFFVPRLGSMIYAMHGMTTDLWLRADKPGTYRGLSSHYSGDGFSDMHFVLNAVPPAQFGAWVAAVKGKGGAMDRPVYTALSQQGTMPPATYGAIQPGLFDAISSGRLPQAPGPKDNQNAAR